MASGSSILVRILPCLLLRGTDGAPHRWRSATDTCRRVEFVAGSQNQVAKRDLSRTFDLSCPCTTSPLPRNTIYLVFSVNAYTVSPGLSGLCVPVASSSQRIHGAQRGATEGEHIHNDGVAYIRSLYRPLRLLHPVMCTHRPHPPDLLSAPSSDPPPCRSAVRYLPLNPPSWLVHYSCGSRCSGLQLR